MGPWDRISLEVEQPGSWDQGATLGCSIGLDKARRIYDLEHSSPTPVLGVVPRFRTMKDWEHSSPIPVPAVMPHFRARMGVAAMETWHVRQAQGPSALLSSLWVCS